MERDWEDLFTVEEVMGGLPAHRAGAVLFAVEGRTAQLVARSRRAMTRDHTGRTAEQEEMAFLAALGNGASLPVGPTIQDIERHAPDWASLVPSEPSIRAALARLLGEKYQIPAATTPRLNRALGIEDPATCERFHELYGVPMSTIFADALPWRERLPWLRARMATRLEALPPFWTAFALTLTETVGAGVLALPIAFAELGVVGAVVIVLVLGLLNVITIAAMAEAVARNGNVRYGRAYFGRLVEDYLGRPGARLLTPTLLVLYVVLLIAYAIGIASTLSESLWLPPVFWVLVLLVVLLRFLRQDSLDATVATALLIGICTIGLLTILSLLAVPHLDISNLRHSEIPFIDGNRFDAGVLRLIFGVSLLALFGHTSTANCAAVVLERDPSARAFIRGCAAALATATVLYIGWIAAMNGAIAPERLAAEPGTALAPLAEIAGPAVTVAGMVFVVLAMGMASVHFAWGLKNATRELLGPRGASGGGRPSRVTSSRTLRELAIHVPIVAIMLFVALLFAIDQASFSGPLGFLGVITAPLVAGIFSMTMLAAARRKGDCAVGYQWRFLGNRLVVAAVCMIFLGAIVVHALFIWTNPVQRVVALAVAVITLWFVVTAARTTSVSRGVAEIRYEPDDDDEMPTVSVLANGEPLVGATVQRLGAGTMHSAVEIRIPPAAVRELMVWVHQLLPDGGSAPMPATLEVNGADSIRLDERAGTVVFPVSGEAQHLIVRPLADSSRIGAV